MKTKQYMRIEKLKKKYSETNIAKGERVSTATRKNSIMITNKEE